MNLAGKVAIVTGASDGLGEEIALALARAKVNLALVSRNEVKLGGVVRQTEAMGVKAKGYVCDVQKNEQVEETVQKIGVDFGEINILVNNAGIWQNLNDLDKIPPEEVESVIQTNLVGVIQMTRAVLPRLREAKEAAIVNVVSRSGVTAQPGQTIYSASKWGVRGFTEVLKVDLKESGIRVAGIYPAGINTNLLEKAGDKVVRDQYSDPKDVAEMVVFMLSRPKSLWLHEVRVEY